jgi:urease gamma subunit
VLQKGLAKNRPEASEVIRKRVLIAVRKGVQCPEISEEAVYYPKKR